MKLLAIAALVGTASAACNGPLCGGFLGFFNESFSGNCTLNHVLPNGYNEISQPVKVCADVGFNSGTKVHALFAVGFLATSQQVFQNRIRASQERA